MKIEFQPQGVCARQIIIDIENDIVNDVKFIGGCSGNTQGVGEIQFTFHGVSLHSLLVQSMTGEKRGFRGRRVAVRAHLLGK